MNLEKIKELRKSINQARGSGKFSEIYSEEFQSELLEKIADSIIEFDDNTGVQLELADILYHFCQYGFSEEIKTTAIDTLALIRESAGAKADINLQLRTFNMFRLLAEPKDFHLEKRNKAAINEVIPYLYTNFEQLRKTVTIFYLDSKSNKYTNILNLPQSFIDSSKHLTQLLNNIIELLLEGPHSYQCFDPQNGKLTSEDIYMKLLNQYINGKLGVELHNKDTQNTLYNALKKLSFLSIPKPDPGNKKNYPKIQQYYEHLQTSASKYLIKHIDEIEKAIEKLLNNSPSKKELDQALAEVESIIKDLDQIKIDKLGKTIEKTKKGLIDLITRLSEKYTN